MIQSPQIVRVARDDITREAEVTWSFDDVAWTVEIRSAGFGAEVARADDAFEALCRIREKLEPYGWRIGVAGALPNVWPSGMARDQGGGLRAYRLSIRGGEDLVDTFEPVDPSSTVTLAEQRAEVDRLHEQAQQHAHRP